MSREPLDRTGQVWEDAFGGRTSDGTPPDRAEGPFVVAGTDPQLRYSLFEVHRCVSLSSGLEFKLFELSSKRWEQDPELERIA